MGTLQIEILKRFLTDKQFSELHGRYKTHRKTLGGVRRQLYLSEAPSKEDIAILEAYLTDLETPTKDIHKFAGRLARNTAVKLLFQHQAILDRLIK